MQTSLLLLLLLKDYPLRVDASKLRLYRASGFTENTILIN